MATLHYWSLIKRINANEANTTYLMSSLARTAILQAATGEVLIVILGAEHRYATSYF